VVERRNRLAHPKAKEVPLDQRPEHRIKEPIPDGATNAVEAMRAFFIRFVEIVPGSKSIVPSLPRLIVLEPWGGEYWLPTGKTYEPVSEGDLAYPMEIELHESGS